MQIVIKAIGLNRFEMMFREDDYAISPTFPSRLEGEAVGVVEALGPNTDTFQVGDRVTVLATVPMSTSGVYAEQANIPVTSLVKSISNSIDVDEAASWLSYITAYGPFIEYGMHQGQSALITAASSAVGLAAIQIVKDRSGIAIALLRVCSITSAGIAVSIALNTSADSITGEIKENSLRYTSRFNCLLREQLSIYPILSLTEKY